MLDVTVVVVLMVQGQTVRPLVVVLALLGAVHYARADATGNQLYDACSAPEQNQVYGAACLSLIDGVSQVGKIRGDFCIRTSGVTMGQSRAVVLRYLEIHPELRHQPAGLLVLQALMQAFPCHQ